jgi:glycerophosphoryl diester phosphodiesterase
LNAKHPVLTLQEIIDLAKARSANTGRTITVYAETKNPTWNNAQAIANGCGMGSHPLEDALIKLLNDNNMNSKTAPVFIQSFEPESLKYLRQAGLNARVVQLIDGNSVNYAEGSVIYASPGSENFVSGRPYSWTVAGDGRLFDTMLTPAGLDMIKTYADGIGPWKPQVMTHKMLPLKARNPDGSAYQALLSDVNIVTPTRLIADAHKAGLFFHAFTFRNEKKYLAGLFNADPAAELLLYFRAGIDGIFTDFSNTAVAARANYLKEIGR